jgi:hypothetical protein
VGAPSFGYFLLRSHRVAVVLANKTSFAGREAKSDLPPGNPRQNFIGRNAL